MRAARRCAPSSELCERTFQPSSRPAGGPPRARESRAQASRGRTGGGDARRRTRERGRARAHERLPRPACAPRRRTNASLSVHLRALRRRLRDSPVLERTGPSRSARRTTYPSTRQNPARPPGANARRASAPALVVVKRGRTSASNDRLPADPYPRATRVRISNILDARAAVSYEPEPRGTGMSGCQTHCHSSQDGGAKNSHSGSQRSRSGLRQLPAISRAALRQLRRRL